MKRLVLSTFLFIVAIQFLACEKISETRQTLRMDIREEEAKDDAPPAPLGAGQVAVATVSVFSSEGVHSFSVDVADTQEAREKGLSGRESLPVNYGMWFVFPEDTQSGFWMKDTLISLDIIFIGSDMYVLYIAPDNEPNSLELVSPSEPYRYVLEIAAGAAKEYDVKVGDRVEFRVGPPESTE